MSEKLVQNTIVGISVLATFEPQKAVFTCWFPLGQIKSTYTLYVGKKNISQDKIVRKEEEREKVIEREREKRIPTDNVGGGGGGR